MAMFRPNWKATRNSNTSIGDNNIRKYNDGFFQALNIMLTSMQDDYYGGTRYFRGYDKRGRSLYYVDQPEIENEIVQNFINYEKDRLRFLVGFTGIGKTTLVRNLFSIQDENVFLSDDGGLVAYYSVFGKEVSDENQLKTRTKEFLLSIKNYLLNLLCENTSSKESFDEFYEVLKKNTIVDSVLDPLPGDPMPSDKDKAKEFMDREPHEYYLTYISYLLELYNRSGSTPIHSLTLIYDDIESKIVNLVDPYMEDILNIYAKMQRFKSTNDERSYNVKTLIVVRNYTVRMISRQTDAYRTYIPDSFFKNNVPKLSDIIKKRFQAYYYSDTVRDEVLRDNWDQAEAEIMHVFENAAEFGELLLSANHLDIARSLRDFMKVLSNHRWFAIDEVIIDGSFGVYSADQYPALRTRMIQALMYGETDIFTDDVDSTFSNILHFHYEYHTHKRSRLACIYVLEYMARLNRIGSISTYGVSTRENPQEIQAGSISGIELKNRIARVFSFEDEEDFKSILEDAISFLYSRRYILRSVFDYESPEDAEKNVVRREYDETFNLYLSKKGIFLLRYMQENSLMFEIFRDDIDTDLENNIVPSARLPKEKCFLYLLQYCGQLFEIEKIYISMAIDKDEYFKSFGGNFLVARFVDGIYYSNNRLFKNDDPAKNVFSNELKELLNNMKKFKDHLIKYNSKLSIKFERNKYNI